MTDPLWINASGGAPAYSANELRQAMSLALMYGGRLLGARQGVRPGGDQLRVTLSSSTITVQPGVCCIDPGLSSPQGPYWVAIPAAETPGPLAAADATNPRKDIVIGRVYDHDEDSSGLRLARSEYLAGVAGPAPAEPAVPAGAIRLATIDVPASGGGSAVVTDRRPWTVAAGGVLPVRDLAEQTALSPWEGMAIYRADADRVLVYDGATFRQLPGTLMVESNRGSSVSGITTEQVVQSATFSAVAGQSYDILAQQVFQSSVANDVVRLRLRWAAGGSVTTAGSEIQTVAPNCDVAARAAPATLIKSFTPGVTGNVTVGVTAALQSGTGPVVMAGLSFQNNTIIVKAC
ncbi:hypothetical protein ABZ777_32530 [Micromonospora parva]|uniref:hypothetical protein n=1 Tax=Micromonospora parva TaxID=1464048 RepID=UPI0033E12004